MKIACIGNMNNIMFQLVRYLTDDGCDVTLFLLKEFDHFLPKADCYNSLEKYKIKSLGWDFDSFVKLKTNKIKAEFSGFDFYIGTDIAPALMYKAGMQLDIFIPHGNDLYDFPFPKYRNKPAQLWEIPKFITGKYQFKGIAGAYAISADLGDELIEKPIRLIRKIKKSRIISPPIQYLKQYTENYKEKSINFKMLNEIRKKYSFLVFQHSSQDWSNRGAFKENKGNDILIKAFANYLSCGNYKEDSALLLVEYGYDLNKSKELVNSLGIENNVIWLPKMYRKDLMAAIDISDICVGELGPQYWYCYSCIYEFMSMKKPLIHHRKDEHYAKLGMDLYPMVDTNEMEVVKNTFLEVRLNPGKFKKMGEEVFIWLNKRNDESLKAFNEVIEKKKNNLLPNNTLTMNFFRQLYTKLNPSLVYSFILLKLYKLKNR